MPKDRMSKAEKVNEIFKDMKKLDPASPVRESEASIQANINSFSSGLKEKAKIYGLIPGTKEKGKAAGRETREKIKSIPKKIKKTGKKIKDYATGYVEGLRGKKTGGVMSNKYEKSIEKAVERNKLIRGAKEGIRRSRVKRILFERGVDTSQMRKGEIDAAYAEGRGLKKSKPKKSKKASPEIKADAAKKGKMIKLKGGGAAIRGTNFKGIF